MKAAGRQLRRRRRRMAARQRREGQGSGEAAHGVGSGFWSPKGRSSLESKSFCFFCSCILGVLVPVFGIFPSRLLSKECFQDSFGGSFENIFYLLLLVLERGFRVFVGFCGGIVCKILLGFQCFSWCLACVVQIPLMSVVVVISFGSLATQIDFQFRRLCSGKSSCIFQFAPSSVWCCQGCEPLQGEDYWSVQKKHSFLWIGQEAL